jgi:hypothetical protein
MLLSADYAHPIPTSAWLIWRENWLYFLADPERNCFVTAHVSLQPTARKAHWTCNLVIDGAAHSHHGEVEYTQHEDFARRLQIGPLTLTCVSPQEQFDIQFDGPDHRLAMTLRGRMPLFDYLACGDANPDVPSISEQVSMGFGLFRHHNQSLTGEGTIEFKKGGAMRQLQGTAYRDHSWGMRNDQQTLRHTWAWMNFPGHTLHFTHVQRVAPADIWSREGYIATKNGVLAFRSSEIQFSGKDDEGLPNSVRFIATDTDGKTHSVNCDLTKRFARNVLYSMKATAQQYFMFHHFTKLTLEESGEEGIGLVEIGMLRTV